MQTGRHLSWPLALMAASLLLLGGFEVVWLRSEFAQQREILAEKQTHTLHGAIRDLEDSLFQLAIWSPFPFEQDSVECEAPRIRITKSAGSDSARVLTFMHNIDPVKRDTLRFRARHPKKGAMFLGTLVRQMTLSHGDSLRTTITLDSLLEEKLHVERVSENGPQYRLITYTSEDAPDSLGIVSKAYFDVSSGTHYALTTPNFKGYLLRQILPQILFAILLFSCIAAAFWLVYRGLRKQQYLAMVRSNLISNITHELKTPISTVHVALEALHDLNHAADAPRRQEYLQIAQSEVNRLALLVDKVLRSSDAANGKSQLKVERFDFRDVISQVLDTLKVQFGRMQADVRLTATGESFEIEADKLHVTGLVHNLLDNAMKYGGSRPEIDVSLVQQNGNLKLSVADKGIGIARPYQDKIFEKFFRVPSGDVHNIKGHGLGLSYVAQVLREHKGSISVESEEGAGSKFTITLPRQHAG